MQNGPAPAHLAHPAPAHLAYPLESLVPRVSIAPLVRVTRDGSRTDQDLVAVEAPLTIELCYGAGASANLGIFMRTPGDDEAFAAGLLHAEGIVRTATDITAMTLTIDADEVSATLRVALAPHVTFDPASVARSGVSTTACGLCGKLTALAAGQDAGSHIRRAVAAGTPELTPGFFFALPERLRAAQAVFEKTGGLHAAAFVNTAGAIVDITEDVGRHNAVDKLIGRALLSGKTPPADGHVLVVSGRVAYEIVQKAAMAGVGTLVAVGAPSSLAVQAARDAGITLIGFAKDRSFNRYG